MSDKEVILEHWGGTYSGLQRNEDCDMVLKFDGTAWMGQFDTDYIHAELAVYGTKLFMRDKYLENTWKLKLIK